jgi:hypothetical protein
VVYDAFISTLTVVGIVTALVYSYKIARSRVYPVGIVRELPEARKSIEAPPEQREATTPPARWEGAGAGKETWRCESCGLVQARGKDLQCRRCKHITLSQFAMTVEKMEESVANEPEQLALEKEIAEHGATLKAHSKLFKDIEKRIRLLEVESVKKSQEAAEERPRPQQAEVIN